MIRMIRLDERLIHGQVATKWSQLLGVNRILVADDISAGNEIVRKSLMMAAPANCKTLITTMDHAISLCKDSRSDSLSILIVVSTPKNLLNMVNKLSDIQEINIGNYGRIAEKRVDKPRKMFTSNLYLYEDEANILRKVALTNVPCVIQTIPDDIPQEMSRILG